VAAVTGAGATAAAKGASGDKGLGNMHGLGWTTLDDTNLAFCFCDFKFRDIRVRNEVDQRLELSQIHKIPYL
jgi:hypothetical protein